MTPDDIEEIFKRSDGEVQPAGGNDHDHDHDHDCDHDCDHEAVLTDEEKQYRVAQLKAVLLVAQNAWVSGSEDLDRIAEKLGDGSRKVLWRSPLGESGILDFFLNILPTPGLRPRLRSHILRLIGNSCADTDENRARVVKSGRIHAIIDLLHHDSLLAFVIPVLYNVMVDYEPLQLQACEAGLSQKLMEILGGPRLDACRPYVNLVCKILALLITQEPESRNGPPAIPLILLSLATNRQHPVDLEDFSGLVSVALAYLTHESFQTSILAAVPVLLTAFSMSYTHFDPAQASDPDDPAQLPTIRIAFVAVLADISALPDFIPGSAQGGAGILQNPVFQTLQSWLHGPQHANLQTGACLALGNLARSDAACLTLVRDAQVHIPLINLLQRCVGGKTPLNAQLTHAVLSFLKNLAIPAANKPQLGRLLEPTLLPKLWSTVGDTQPQTQFAAVSLARLLLVGCPPNVRRLCAPLSADADSPAHERSNLHLLMALFERCDTEPTKMEIARAVATVCRILHTTPVGAVLPEEPHPHGPKRARHGSSATTTNNGDGGTIHARTGSFSPTSATGFSPSSATFHRYHSPPNNTTTTTNQQRSSSPSSPSSTTSSTAAPASTSLRARFYAAHDLALPLSFLIKQTRFPTLRSEAWFVLALMARAPDGVRVVQAALESFEACRALVEAVTGRDMADGHDLLLAASRSPAAEGQEDGPQRLPGGESSNSSSALRQQQLLLLAGGGIEGLGLGSLEPVAAAAGAATQAGMARIDRENGLCLLAELVRAPAADLPPLRRNIYEQLLVTGGELVLRARRAGTTGAAGAAGEAALAGLGQMALGAEP